MNKKKVVYLILVSLVGISGMVIAFRPIDNFDPWLHIGIGKWIVQNGSIPTQDVFSHTIDGKPWIPHEWLSQITYYLIDNSFGLQGIKVFNVLMFCIFFIFLERIIRKSYPGKVAIPIIALSFCTFWALTRFMWRPENFTLVFMVIFVDYLLMVHPSKPPKIKMSLLLCALIVIWANFHGMAIFAVGLSAVYIGILIILSLLKNTLPPENEIIERRKLLQWIFLLAGLVICIFFVPQGLMIPKRALEIATSSSSVEFPIAEWSSWFEGFRSWIDNRLTLQALSSYTPQDFFCLLYLVLLVTFPVWLWKIIKSEKLGDTSRFVIAVFALIVPLYVVRFTWLLFIPVVYVLIMLSSESKEISESEKIVFSRSAKQIGNASVSIFAAISVGMLIWSGLSRADNSYKKPYKSELYPVGISSFLKESGLKGRLFNPYHWGGYFIYSSFPDLKVFIDGRNNAYAENDKTIFADYDAIETAGMGWEKIFNDRNVDIVVMCWGLDSIFPPRPYRKSEKFNGLVPIMYNPEGIVFLRSELIGGNPEYINQVKSYFNTLGISFNEKSGFRSEDIIDSATDKAIAFNLVPEDFFENIKKSNDLSIEKKMRHQAAIEVADALIRLGIDKRAEKLYSKILEEDDNNVDALCGICKVAHFRGEYLESLKWAEKVARLYPYDERGHIMARHMWNEHGSEIQDENTN